MALPLNLVQKLTLLEKLRLGGNLILHVWVLLNFFFVKKVALAAVTNYRVGVWPILHGFFCLQKCGLSCYFLLFLSYFIHFNLCFFLFFFFDLLKFNFCFFLFFYILKPLSFFFLQGFLLLYFFLFFFLLFLQFHGSVQHLLHFFSCKLI